MGVCVLATGHRYVMILCGFFSVFGARGAFSLSSLYMLAIILMLFLVLLDICMDDDRFAESAYISGGLILFSDSLSIVAHRDILFVDRSMTITLLGYTVVSLILVIGIWRKYGSPSWLNSSLM